MGPDEVIKKAKAWAASRNDIRAVALVGSYARGDARPDSDIDLVLLCSDPPRYLEDTRWVSTFGVATATSIEDWGRVQSVRVHYRDGNEVEFGITSTDWAASPPDAGTVEVLRNGGRILVDRDGELTSLLETVEKPE